jgi:hypothetical protein
VERAAEVDLALDVEDLVGDGGGAPRASRRRARALGAPSPRALSGCGSLGWTGGGDEAEASFDFLPANRAEGDTPPAEPQRGTCRFAGEQGALIPASNAENLMLRPDVVEAARQGQFHVHPVATIDQGIELLTGLPAGELQADGTYPEGSVNRRVHDALRAMTDRRLELMRRAGAPPGARR